MAYQQNDNSGSLFRNEKKNTPAQPDYEGSATINGTYLRIAAWIKTSKNGTKYMSLAFNEPQPVQQPPIPRPQAQKPTPAPAPAPADGFTTGFEDDIPF